MLRALDHGFTGLFFAYGLALLGVFAGLRFRHESLTAFKTRLPLIALFALAAALLLWVVIGELNLLYLGQAPPWAREFLGASVVVLVGVLAGLRAALPGTGVIVHRGTRLLERSDHTPERDAGAPSFPTFAGHSVPPADETKHFKVLGTTGTGKSTAIRELLRGALARGDRAVIADPDGGYGRRPGNRAASRPAPTASESRNWGRNDGGHASRATPWPRPAAADCRRRLGPERRCCAGQ